MGNKCNKEKRPDLDPSIPSGGVPSSSSTRPNDHPSPNAGLSNSSSKSDNESSNSSPLKTDSSSDPPPPNAVLSVPAPRTLSSEPPPPSSVASVPAPRTLPSDPPPPNAVSSVPAPRTLSSDPPSPSSVVSVPAPRTLPSEPAPPSAVPIVPAPRTLPPPPNIKPSNRRSPKSKVRNAGPPSPWTGRKVSRQERRRIERIKRKSKAPPLSVENVMTVLETLPWRKVGNMLFVPYSKLDAIGADHTTDEGKKGAVIRYWLLRDPYASWRRLIDMLDREDKFDMADQIRNYAEKQTDPSLTCHSLLTALDTVKNAKDNDEIENSVDGILEDVLIIPPHKSKEMRSYYADEEDYRKKLVEYFITISPWASWNHVAGGLLGYEHHGALEKVKGNVKVDKDPSLNLTNLTKLLEDVEDWDDVGKCLAIPDSVRDISKQHSSMSQRKEACWEWYLNNHPSPSWHDIAYALYMNEEHEVLEVLKSQYLKGSSESRRLYNEAMKQGHVKSQINKVLLYGAPGTGKSSSMDLFVGNPPRKVRISTPVAARPITMFQVGVTAEEWKRLPPKEQKKILARAIYAQLHANDSDSGRDSVSGEASGDDSDSGELLIEKETDTTPQHANSSTRDENAQVHSASPSSSKPTRKPKKGSVPEEKFSLPSISTHEELMELLDEISDLDEPSPVFRKVKLIDSGGQPQFHEVLPVFLRRMSLYIFVFKLSEELATKPMVEYFGEDGERVGTPYQSAQSNEQLLKHCLRTLHTHRSSPDTKGECSKIMIVGTHRDEEHLCTTETREEKNKKLAELLLPMFQEEVIYYNLPENELIFPVNAKNPNEFDKGTARDIQSVVLTQCMPDPIDVPLQYFSLEIVLEEVSLSLGRGILSKEECLRAADKLYFDEHTLGAALQFLDEISAVFYFPEVLEGVVFTNPQVLLDKVTELVEKIYCLRQKIGGKKLHALSGEWQKFKDHGIVSLELLQEKEFEKHYVPDIFTPVDLVKLFRKLLIIADFSASEYIMPALLPVLEAEKVHEYRVTSSSPVAPLALAFPLGAPRLGTYCSLTSFLVSPDNQFPCPWKIMLLPRSNTPACLNRNCVLFSVPGHPGSVSLIDTFTHFEVHVDTAQTSCSKLCSLVSQAILSGLKKATVVLGYNNSIPSKAVLCPCGGEDPHTATFGDGVWICSRNSKVFGELTDKHKLWCDQADHSPTKGTSTSSTPTMMEVITFPLEDRKVNLSQEIGTKYLEFGTLLLEDTTGARICALEEELRHNAQSINHRIFQKWLSGEGRKPVSWQTLISVLEDIGLSELAKSIAHIKQ